MQNNKVDALDRFERAVQRIDAANAEDPTLAASNGRELPAALLYGQRITAWLDRLAPDSSEALRLAVRCQHIRRWSVPRAQFPMDRAGYHRWRTHLAGFHARQAADILGSVGYDEPTIARVQSL